MVKISPSLLSADFTRLGEDIVSVRTAEYLHFDVMDGVFVPNISVGLPVLEAVRRVTDAILDVHLMIIEPVRYAGRFARAGADIVTFHIEADSPDGISAAIDEVLRLGKRPGLAIKPATPAESVAPYIDKLGMVVVMAVEPGYSGQKFMPEALPKIRALRDMIDARGSGCEIEADGGINAETAALCIEAGASVLVSGSDLFNSADRAARIRRLRGDLGA
ncbi:MAG: ribulose-phosphate 3-epimerase [Oscillospiraceae bacterium]|jgi:ribulose-phosphate 3-epimerase|nr:ribulose-phosphate 3-epimerase [Oscillospiraceae bacterium]